MDGDPVLDERRTGKGGSHEAIVLAEANSRRHVRLRGSDDGEELARGSVISVVEAASASSSVR